MKRLLPGMALGLLLVLNPLTHAQELKPATDDASAVRTTVRDYIEAYYTGDAPRMQQTLHSHYLKHVIHGEAHMREMTATQIVDAVRSGRPEIPAADQTEQITVLDIAGNIASAKLVVPGWTDYLTLSKSDGTWRILSVVQRLDD